MREDGSLGQQDEFIGTANDCLVFPPSLPPLPRGIEVLGEPAMAAMASSPVALPSPLLLQIYPQLLRNRPTSRTGAPAPEQERAREKNFEPQGGDLGFTLRGRRVPSELMPHHQTPLSWKRMETSGTLPWRGAVCPIERVPRTGSRLGFPVSCRRFA